jgi:hypothetical protein
MHDKAFFLVRKDTIFLPESLKVSTRKKIVPLRIVSSSMAMLWINGQEFEK